MARVVVFSRTVPITRSTVSAYWTAQSPLGSGRATVGGPVRPGGKAFAMSRETTWVAPGPRSPDGAVGDGSAVGVHQHDPAARRGVGHPHADGLAVDGRTAEGHDQAVLGLQDLGQISSGAAGRGQGGVRGFGAGVGGA